MTRQTKKSNPAKQPKEPQLTKVAFTLDDGENEPMVETMWAEKLGRSRYRLLNFPAFQYDISYEDIFEAKPDSSSAYPRLCFTRVLEKCGNRTIRIFFERHAEDPDATTAAIDALTNLECQYSGGGAIFTLNLPPACSWDAVVACLEAHGALYEFADPKSGPDPGDGEPS